jgi:hypothetical protein
MELYKITATCSNDATSKEFDYLPENFEGVKIVQSFSFQNPIGYTPKASVSTFRVALSDKEYLDNIFNTFGLESSVILEIQELNSNGITYDFLFNFAVDFESYEIFDVYSEFALKGISVIDEYNKIKNTEVQRTLDKSATMPNVQKYINYISLKSNGVSIGTRTDTVINFASNNESKIYNGDESLTQVVITGMASNTGVVYKFNSDAPKDCYILKVNGSLKITLNFQSNGNTRTVPLTVKVYKYDPLFQYTPIYTFYNEEKYPGTYEIDINADIADITDDLVAGDYFFIMVNAAPEWAGPIQITTTCNLYCDMKIKTNVLVLEEPTNIKYIDNIDLLNSFFNNKVVTYGFNIANIYATTSENNLTKSVNQINVKPKDFVNDICTLGGLVMNYKLNGTVQFESISTYFADLFDIANNPPIEVVDYQDLSIKYSQDLLFSGVEVGQEAKEYDNYTYLIDWNKVLTFKQNDRNAKEVLNLVPSKLRSDFSGMLDAVIKRSQQIDKNLKDNYIFEPSFSIVQGSEPEILLYDNLTPRNILNKWEKFLSFAFQNFGKNTLTISSDGGTPDNLEVNGVKQMDNLVLNESRRLLPIEIIFTCVMETVDFSEKILKITHNSEIIYIFVTEAETMSDLREQKIKGLKIQL